MKSNYFSNSNNGIKVRVGVVRLLLIALVCFAQVNTTFAQVTLTTPSLTITTCSFPSGNFTLGDIVIAESAVGDISTFGSIDFTAPAGFEFVNEGTATFSGTDISAISSYILNSPASITLTFAGSGTAGFDTITLSGIQIRATSASVGANITRSGGTSVINGDPDGTNHATLTSILNSATPGTISFSVAGDTLMCSPANPSNITGTVSTGPGGSVISYQWQSSADLAFTSPSNVGANSTSYNPGAGVVSDVYYRRIATSTLNTVGCSSISDTLSVTIVNPPTVTNSSTKTICSGSGTGISLTASIPSTFVWTIGTIAGGITGASASSGSTLNQTLTNPSSVASGSVDYVVTPTSTTGLCTGTTFTITVTVNPKPLVTNAATKSICSGAATGISLTSSVPSTFTWILGTINGAITGALAGSGATINQILTNPSNATAGSVEYIVTPTSSTGLCTGTTFTITVTVNPSPSVTTAATKTICSGASSNVVLTASAASDFSWTVGAITGSITGAAASSGSTINQVLTNPSNSASGTVDFVVTPTSTAGSCVGSPYTITVTVNPIPVVTNASTKSICSGASTGISLTSSVASSFSWTIGTITGAITGSSANSGGTISQTLSNPSNTTAGTVPYLVTPTSSVGSCAGAAYTITVTVNPLPAITNSLTSTICSGTGPGITLTSSAASSFSWTIGTNIGSISGALASSGSSINQTLTNPSNTTAGSVEYVVTPTSTSGSCAGSSSTFIVTVNPTPAVTNSATKTICSGASSNISLTSSAASNFTWTIGTIVGTITGSAAGSGSAINQTLTNSSSSAAGSVDYVVTPTSTSGTCAGSPFTITVTVNPIPVVTNASTKSICSGASTSISLTSSVASSFSWTIGTITGGITGSSASSGATINQTLTNPSNTTAGTVPYLITPTSTSGSCAGAAYTITVTVNPVPVLTNSVTASICSGSGPGITLTSSAASTFSWTIGTNTGSISGALASSGSSINQTLTNPSNISAGSVEYVITPTSTGGSCVGVADTITVTVNPVPVVTNAATKTICSGASSNISLTSSAASNFTWTIGTITGGILGSAAGSGSTINQTLTNPSSSAAGTVPYNVTPTSTSGSCAGSPYTITVTVNPIPVVTNASTKSICSGASTAISLTSSVASSFSWTIGTITGAITGSSASSGASIAQVLSNPSNSASGTVQYLVTPTSTSGSCAGAATTITVTVNPVPAVTNGSTATICSGTSPNIALTASAASSFSWTLGTNIGTISGAVASSGSTINQTLTNPSNTTAGSIEYVVTPTSTGGSCAGSSSTITVTVNPAPVVTNSSTKSICSGVSTNIVLTSSAASSFTWTIGTITNGITGSLAGSGGTINQVLTNPSSSLTGTVEYVVTPTSTGGSCAGSPFTITVTVYPIPAVTNASTKSICSGASTALALTSSVASSFSWTIGTITGAITGSSASSGATIAQILSNPSNSTSGSVQYLVTPTSTSGSCAGAATTITVTVNPVPAVTNGATATICSGTSPNIALTASAASSFSWTLGTNIGTISGAVASSGSTINQTLTNPSNTTAGSIEYLVTPTSTGGSCAGSSSAITVTVNPAPAVTNSSTKSICSGVSTNIALTSSVASSFIWTIGTITNAITGASAGSGATINQILTNPSSSLTGTVEYIVTPTSSGGSCAGSPFTITVTVYPIPAVTNASTKTICSGASTSIALTSSAASSFSWTIGTISGAITGSSANSGATIGQTLNNPSNAAVGSVQYLVTPTSTSGSCVGAASTITVTVNPAPALTSAISATVCSGTSPNIALTASAASSFSWTIGTNIGLISGATASSGTSINQTLNNPDNATSGSIEYIVTPTSTGGSCAGVATTVTVTVNPTPVVTNSASVSACNGISPNISLTSSVASSFSWTIGTITGGITGASAGSGATINQTLTNPSSSATGSVQYLVTPTSTVGACAGSAYTITVNVYPTPVVTNSSTATVCSGISPNIALTATAASNFSWTIGAITGGITGASASSGATINQTLTNPGNASAGTVQYLVTPTTTSGSCAGAAYTITITVNPAPAVTTASTATICSGSSPNISLTSSVPSSYSWTIGTNVGTISGALAGTGSTINQSLTNPSDATAGSVQYLVTPVSSTGSCTGSTYTITVTVNPVPSITNSATKTICSGISTGISLTSSVTSNFSWTIGTVSGGITGASASSGGTIGQALTNPSNSASGYVEYNVTATSTGGSCAASPFMITVTVNPVPLMTNTAAKTICSGAGTNISLTSSTASSYAWTIGTITGGITGSSAGSGANLNQTLTNPTNTTIGSVQYFVTPTSTGGSCAGAAFAITVAVNPLPALTNAATASACSGTSPNIALTSSVASNFAWTIGTITGSITGATAGTGATINQTLTNPSNTTDGTVPYIITPTSTGGSCVGAPSTITVTVVHSPTITNVATASTCSGVAPNIALTASEASTFSWTIGAITGSITGASASSGASINQVLTNPSNVNVGTVEYLVTPTSDAGSCQGPVYYITITVNPAPAVTNGPTGATCSGGSPNISLTSSAPGSFSWAIGTIAGGITGASAGSGATINQTLTNPSNATAGSVEYLVIPTATLGSCVGASSTITVTVNVAPIAVIAGGANQTVCSGTALPVPISFNTSNNIIGTTYAWTRDDTLNVTGTKTGTGNITGLVLSNTTTLPRTVTFTITPTGPAPTFCVGAPITTTLVINPVPSLTSTLTPLAICSGATFSYTATSNIGGSTYSWSRAAVANIAPATSSGTSNISESLTNSSTAPINVTYVYQVSASGCTNPTSYSVVLTVNVYPSLSSTLTPPAICSGSTFSYTPLSNTPGASFSWTRAAVTGVSNLAGSGTNNPSEILNDTALTSIDVKYVYTSAAGGCTNSVKDTVVVSVKPKAQLSSSLTPPAICSGTLFSYTPTSLVAGASFSWSRAAVSNISNIAASGTDNPNETLINTSANPVSVFYVYTITANGCSYTQDVTVVVNPVPVFTSTLTPSAICSGSVFNYTPQSSTAGASFTWSRASVIGISNGPGAGVGNPNETLINTTDSSIVVRYVFSVSANGCTNPSNYNVDVTVSLVSALSSTLSPPAICSGSTFSYTPTSTTSGTIFSWTRAQVVGISNNLGAGTSNPNEPLTNITAATINVEYVYSLTANGCTNPTSYTVVVPVYPKPALSSSLNPPAVCSGSLFSYMATSATGGASFSWTRAAVAGISNVAGMGTGDVSEVLTNTTTEPVAVTYVYTVIANGCSEVFNVNVTVNPIPLFTSTLTPAATCSGVPFIYTPGSSTLGATYTWIRAAVAGISNVSDTGTAGVNEILINTTANPVTNVVYAYSVTANGCTNPSSYSVMVTVNPAPVFTSSPTPPPICSGTVFAYTPTSSTAGASFAWTRSPVAGITNIGGSGTNSPNEVLTNSTIDSVNVTYVYTLSANGCTNPTGYSIVVAVNASPTLSSTLFPPAICSGDTFSYTPQSLTPGATFVWNRAAVSGIFNVAGSGVNNPNEILYDTTAFQKTVTYAYTVTAKGCSDTAYVNLTVNPSPVLISSQTPAAICNNTAFSYIPLSSTVGASYTWIRPVVVGISNPADTGIGNPNEVLINTLTSPVSVTYEYTVTAGGCTNSTTFNVIATVNPTPVLTSSLTPPAICSGTAFGYVPTSSTIGASFSWTRAAVPGINNVAGSGTGNPNEILNNTTTSTVSVTYVYTVSINGCSNPTTFSVVVNVLPTPLLTSTSLAGTVCSYSTFTYYPTSQLPGVTFSWTRVAVPGVSNITTSGTDSINEVLILSDTVPQNVTYIFTLSTSTCTNPITDSVIVSVIKPCLCNHQLTSTLKPNDICSNTSFSYAPTSSSTGALFSWTRDTIAGISNPGTTGSGNPNETLVNTTDLPIDVTYSYIVFADGCANPSPFDVVVTVNPIPTLSSSLNPAAICSGSTFAYTPMSGTPGATFDWTRAAVNGISNGPGNGAGGPNEDLVNSTTIPVEATYVYTVSANGCINSTVFSVDVTVNPTPTLSSTLTPPAICSGSIFSYVPVSATSGVVFAWNRPAESGISEGSASGTGNPNEVLTSLSSFPLYVTYEYTLTANNCSNIQEVIVTVNPAPVLTSGLGPFSICSGTTFNYTPTSVISGAAYTWTRAAVAGISNLATGGNGDPDEALTNTSSDPVDVTYEYTVSANGCTNTTSYSVLVTVNPIPTMSSSLAPVTICSGTLFSYTPTSATANASFVWNRPAVAGISNIDGSGTGNPNEILFDTTSAPVNTTYEFMLMANGCIDTTVYELVVTVDPYSLNVDAGSDVSVNFGSSVGLQGTGGTSYSWSPITGLNNPNAANPTASPSETTTYTLTVTDVQGCVGIDTVTVSVIPDQTLIIASIMTPNGDGKNDTWIIQNIENAPNTEIIIVNNQGQKVYLSSNYQNDWDGTYKGKQLPDGTYYYFLKFANGGKVYSGSLTIFRD